MMKFKKKSIKKITQKNDPGEPKLTCQTCDSSHKIEITQ
jgi:hypothetical protein